jgi:hypothetical protein
MKGTPLLIIFSTTLYMRYAKIAMVKNFKSKKHVFLSKYGLIFQSKDRFAGNTSFEIR